MPADVPRTMAKRGSAATRIVMKTSRPISPLQSRSLSGREFRLFGELISSESGRERREASPTAPRYGARITGWLAPVRKLQTRCYKRATGVRDRAPEPFLLAG